MTASVFIAIVSMTLGQNTSVVHSGVRFTTGLEYPGRLAPDGAGGAYVTDPPTGAVHHFDAAGLPVGLSPYAIPEGAVGIAVFGPNIFISRRDGQVGIYDSAFVEQPGSPLAQPPVPMLPLMEPNDLGIDPVAGEVYVVDSGSHQVLVYNATTLVFRTGWGLRGTAAGEFEFAQALALDVSDPIPANHRVYVADTDGFRVQAFDTNGMPKNSFGYRTLYVGDADQQVAWFARSAGLAVDECGLIYVSDALMGTVRVFDSSGDAFDRDPDPGVDNRHDPLIVYGTGPGEVRLPCDIMYDNGKLFVASTGNSAVEIYDVVCTPPGLRSSGNATDMAARPVSRKQATQPVRLTDTPFAIAEAALSGEYSSSFDLNRDRTVNEDDVAIAADLFGAGTVELFMTGESADPTAFRAGSVEGPHLNDDLNIACWRCHAMNGLPNGERAAEGQENLCLSCHSSANLGMHDPIPVSDKHLSHPTGIPADEGEVQGPAPESLLSWHLDDEGDVRCGTCHNPHTSDDGEPYLRAQTDRGQLCGECHVQTAEWLHAGHADEEGEAFVHYDWSLSNRSSCRRCHTGNGYVDWAAGLPAAEQNGAFRVHDCLTCHATHGASQDEHLLRVFDEVEMPWGDVLTGLDHDATCVACHNGRYEPNTGHLTPHYLLGGVMLLGINGIDFGATLTNSRHTTVAGCADCHMGEPAAGGKVGGHSFNIVDHDSGFENVDNTCNAAACHGNTGGLTTVNRPAHGDFDGDGTTEGVQDEVQGLLDLVLVEIEALGVVKLGGYPYWNLSGLDPAGFCDGGLDNGLPCVADAECDDLVPGDGAGSCMPADEPVARSAIWNWDFVDNDASLGVHNTDYAVGLLQVTYEALTGGPVPGAALRYTPAGFGPTIVSITDVNGGLPVIPGDPFTVDFTIEDDQGDPIDRADLNRLVLFVGGPSSNYQLVIYNDSTAANFVQNPDGSYTYSLAAFPGVYLAPRNDSAAYGAADGELTGLPLADGTYTVLIESRRVFGSLRQAGDATSDFIVDSDGLVPPPLAPRQFVLQDNCNACHLNLQMHGSNRFSVTGCVVCHTRGAEDRITVPDSTPGRTIQFGKMIHRLHQGHGLPNVEATVNTALPDDRYRYEVIGYGESVHDFSDVGFPVIPMGTLDCAKCHGGAAQEAQIYNMGAVAGITNYRRFNCGSCHDDISFVDGMILDQAHPDVDAGILTEAQLSDPTYRVFPGVDVPPFIPVGTSHIYGDDTACVGCHGTGGLVDVEVAHTHSTVPAPEGDGTEPRVEIVSIGGMTGGGGTYFQAGDVPEVTFRLYDNTTDPLPLQLVPGDATVVDRLYAIVAGPTTLYQNIIPGQRFWNNGSLSVAPANFVDNFAVDGSYTFIFLSGIPADYPAQLNTIGEPPADQIFPFEDGWGQQYTVGGTPLDTGTYTVMVYGRRRTATNASEPVDTSTFDVPFGAAGPIVPYAGTVTTDSCNACHRKLAFHGNQREGVRVCLACHTAGTQDGGTANSVDFRQMLHKLHNARNLTNLPYELNGFSGIDDFSTLLISAMPGEAAECEVCHDNDDWKIPPVRSNMRTWMTVCTSCHDSVDVAAHADAMTLPGTFTEMCSLCHGDGAAYSVETVHKSP